MLRWAIIGRVSASATRGEVEEAMRQHVELDALGHYPATIFDGELRRADAALARAEGRLDDARAILEAAALEVGELGDLATEAACLHDLLRLGRAHQVRDRLTRLADCMQGRWVGAFSLHASALAADDADQLLEVSQRFEQIGAMALATEAAQEAADAFARGGDQRAAARLANRATELSAHVDGDVRRSALGLAGADPLTQREREVAELAADGLSSKLIGERLFVSTRTVESHLLRIYAKLGVRTRAELIEMLSMRSR